MPLRAVSFVQCFLDVLVGQLNHVWHCHVGLYAIDDGIGQFSEHFATEFMGLGNGFARHLALDLSSSADTV